MLPVTAQASISASREEIYDYIADLGAAPRLVRPLPEGLPARPPALPGDRRRRPLPDRRPARRSSTWSTVVEVGVARAGSSSEHTAGATCVQGWRDVGADTSRRGPHPGRDDVLARAGTPARGAQAAARDAPLDDAPDDDRARAAAADLRGGRRGALARATVAAFEPTEGPRFGGARGRSGDRLRAPMALRRSIKRRVLVRRCAAPLLSRLRRQPARERRLREGLPEEVGKIDYNVYITRELNTSDVEDLGYYQGPEAPPGFALYGVFMVACNPRRTRTRRSSRPRRTSRSSTRRATASSRSRCRAATSSPTAQARPLKQRPASRRRARSPPLARPTARC